jgi:hypothetical protein
LAIALVVSFGVFSQWMDHRCQVNIARKRAQACESRLPGGGGLSEVVRIPALSLETIVGRSAAALRPSIRICFAAFRENLLVKAELHKASFSARHLLLPSVALMALTHARSKRRCPNGKFSITSDFSISHRNVFTVGAQVTQTASADPFDETAAMKRTAQLDSRGERVSIIATAIWRIAPITELIADLSFIDTK